jgi:SAM-dependent methyltransferase
VTGAFLAQFGGQALDGDLYMLDGARRISAHALAGVGMLTTLVVMPPEHYATLLPSEEVASLQQRVDSVPWFGGYQSIPLLGIRGNRTSRRFEHMDLGLLRGARVMDFGCNVGQASLAAAVAGAVEVIGVDGVQESCACAAEAARLSGFDSVHFCHVNFNAPDFADQIDAMVPGGVDYSFFFSVYRTKELTQRDRLFEYILEKTRKSVFFEGHSDPRIDSQQYYHWLFESFGLRWEFLGHGEGDSRPLFVLSR